MRIAAASIATVLAVAASAPPVQADEALWALLKAGGHVVVLRHASTEPGTGDPPGFRLAECATQRNLSRAGREEAERIGAAFRARGVPVGAVLSSQWCRCLETARLAFGEAKPWPPLNSFFDDRSQAPEQTRQVRRVVGERPPSGNLVLVTHQVNITALTGVAPAQGEMIILTPSGNGRFDVVGRLKPAAE